MLHGTVQNQHGNGIVIHRHQLIFQSGAIQLKGHALLAVGGNELVHDAAGHIHELVFHGLPDQGYLLGINPDTGKGGQCGADGDFQGGAGRKAAAARHVAVNQHVHRADFYAAPMQIGQHAAHVIGPERLAGNQGILHGNFMYLVSQRTAEAMFADRGRSYCDDTMIVQSHGHHKTIIIIRVLANEVHTSRCRCHMSWSLTEILDEIRSHRFFRDFSLN